MRERRTSWSTAGIERQGKGTDEALGGVLVLDVLADDAEEDDALLPMCEWGSAAEVLDAIRYTTIGTPDQSLIHIWF